MSSPHSAESAEPALSKTSSESSKWLFAEQRLRESGIPPAHERLWIRAAALAGEADEHVELALAECTRTEANLGALLRGLSHLTAGATAAREANAALLRELDTMKELLGRSSENEFVLLTRVQKLEQALESAERDAALSRAVLLEQEDLFLAELLTDHEREVSALKRALAEAEAESATRRALPISTLPPPPDFEAPEAIERISTLPPPPDFDAQAGEHAAAAIEIEMPPTSRAPLMYMESAEQPVESSRRIDSRPIAAVQLRTIAIGPPVRTYTPEIAPPPSAPSPNLEAKPAASALEASTTADEPNVAPTPETSTIVDEPPLRESKPVIKLKPDLATRPLVGYSLGGDEVAEEVIDTSRLGPRPQDR